MSKKYATENKTSILTVFFKKLRRHKCQSNYYK